MPSKVINLINRRLANRNRPAERRPPACTSDCSTESPPVLNPLLFHEIFSVCESYGCVKRADIVRFCRNVKRNQFGEIIQQINEQLRDIYGCELFEDDKQQGVFYLICILPKYDPDEMNPFDKFSHGVCYAVLAVIFMLNPVHLRLPEAVLWKQLSFMGLCDTDGGTMCRFMEMDLKTLICDRFIRHGWLRREAVPNTNPVVREYAWGARANRVIDKTKMLTFVSKVYGFKEGAQAWPEHTLSCINDSSVGTSQNA